VGDVVLAAILAPLQTGTPEGCSRRKNRGEPRPERAVDTGKVSASGNGSLYSVASAPRSAASSRAGPGQSLRDMKRWRTACMSQCRSRTTSASAKAS
jgi:hypothetical protein